MSTEAASVRMDEAPIGRPATREPAPELLETIPSLDGIRAVAALLVMVLHFVNSAGYGGLIRKISVAGQTGVDLFFVLSGFLITRILLASVRSPAYYRTFYVRRILRIFPLYYAFLAAFFFLVPLLRHGTVSSAASQSWSWLYLQNVPMTFVGLASSGPPHFWSLAVEEHFYLLWPVLVAIFAGRGFGGVLAVTLLLPIGVRALFLSRGIGTYYFTLTRMDAIAWGALVAYLHAGKRGLSQKHTAPRIVLVAGAVVLIAAFVAVSGSGWDWLQLVKLSLVPAWFAALLHFVLADPLGVRLSILLARPVMRSIGKISYGLYVFHPLVFDLALERLDHSNVWLCVAVSFGLTVVLARLSYHYFEAPFLRLKQRFAYDPRVVTT